MTPLLLAGDQINFHLPSEIWGNQIMIWPTLQQYEIDSHCKFLRQSSWPSNAHKENRSLEILSLIPTKNNFFFKRKKPGSNKFPLITGKTLINHRHSSSLCSNIIATLVSYLLLDCCLHKQQSIRPQLVMSNRLQFTFYCK